MNENKHDTENNILNFPSEINEDAETRQLKRKQKYKKRQYTKYALSAVCIVLLFALIISVLNKKDSFENSEEVNRTVIDTLSNENYAFASYREGYIYAKDGKITCLNTNQEVQWELKGSKTQPKISVYEEYAVVYYPNDSMAVVTDGSKSKTIKTDGNVTYASVNKNGYIAMIVEESGFKSQFAVYDFSGKSLYKRHNSDVYATSAKLSGNNKYLLLSSVGFNEKNVSADVLIFNITKKDEEKKLTFEDSVVCDLEFINKNNFVVVLDNKIVYCNVKAEKKQAVDYGGKSLCTYDVNNIGNIALVFGDDSAMSGSEIFFYNSKGKKKGSCKTDEKITQVCMQGSTTLAACDRKLMIFNLKGKKIDSKEVGYDVRKSYFLGDKKTILTLAGSGAYLVSVN